MNHFWKISISLVFTLLMFPNSYAKLPSNCPPPFKYQVDPFWPKPLPNHWIIGEVNGIAIDAQDHIWILHRPGLLTNTEKGATLKPPLSICCIPAPPVIEFDQAGNVLRAWGGPGKGYDWPSIEHGLYIDPKGFIWITGIGPNDGQILKFTPEGKFLMQIGKVGPQTNSQDTTRVGKAANVTLDPKTNELYVADGYFNHRVIVFDAHTGAFKRLWGAYGKSPVDIDTIVHERYAPTQADLKFFGTPVHCVRFSKEGLLYVCDRRNNRIQIFKKDGTYVKELFVLPKSASMGSVWDILFSPDPNQCYLYLIDGTNNQLHTLDRQSGNILSSFSQQGRNAGQFHWVHSMGMDSKGTIYTGEVATGARVQRFIKQ